jgi:hypothetical protein
MNRRSGGSTEIVWVSEIDKTCRYVKDTNVGNDKARGEMFLRKQRTVESKRSKRMCFS